MTDSLVALLHASTRRFPDACAIVADDVVLSYATLWRRMAGLARFLIDHGLQPGERVALLAENSPDYVVTYYGVLRAGGVIVALNAAARERDLRIWIEHCGARWLMGQAQHPAWSALVAELPGVRTIAIGVPATGGHLAWDAAVTTPVSADDVWPMPEPQAPAAILYTSGTTGRPKGVTLSHRNLAANVQSILAYLPIDADSRIVNVLPFYYSYGNSVLHTHLAAGGCVVLENSLAYPHRVVERLAQTQATGFSGVPSTYALLLSRVRLQDYDLRHLRYITQAGGAMPAALTQRLREALPHVALYVMYGQTEATARLSFLPPERLGDKLGSAGHAIPGVTLEVRAEDGRPVAPGTVGEIWARGDNVMLGYWNDAPATATTLVDGWLRTGDMARMDAEGFVYIEGRRSDMIKSGAHRINPVDIEEAIAELPGVAEVAVVGVADELLGQVIKAVVVPAPGQRLDAMAIKAHCRDRLPVYKMPKFIEFVAMLPKTASGKVKRFELAATTREQKIG